MEDGVAEQELEIKLTPTAQIKLKIIRTESGLEDIQVTTWLKEALGLARYEFSSVATLNLLDEYLDTVNLQLYRQSCSCRVRTQSAARELTIKTPTDRILSSEPGLFVRGELKLLLSEPQYRSLIDDGILPQSMLRNHLTSLSELKLKKVCEIANTRTLLKMQRANSEFELAIDKFSFFNPGLNFRFPEDSLEIEIEAINPSAKAEISSLLQEIRQICKLNGSFTFSTRSKYDAAVNHLRLDKSGALRVLLSRDGDIALVLGVFALLAGVVAPLSPVIGASIGISGAVLALARFRQRR